MCGRIEVLQYGSVSLLKRKKYFLHCQHSSMGDRKMIFTCEQTSASKKIPFFLLLLFTKFFGRLRRQPVECSDQKDLSYTETKK